MSKKLYIGNLSYELNDSDLQNLFTSHGSVVSARVVTDKYTGRSKGFGFVEMSSAQEAEAAIDALNGKEISGRELIVNEARPQVDQGSRTGGGFNRGRRNS